MLDSAELTGGGGGFVFCFSVLRPALELQTSRTSKRGSKKTKLESIDSGAVEVVHEVLVAVVDGDGVVPVPVPVTAVVGDGEAVVLIQEIEARQVGHTSRIRLLPVATRWLDSSGRMKRA